MRTKNEIFFHYFFPKGTETAGELGGIMRLCLQEQRGQKTGYEPALRGHRISLYVSLVRNCRNTIPQLSATDQSEIETNFRKFKEKNGLTPNSFRQKYCSRDE